MKKLPLGIQTFSKIVDLNCVYVDKTKQIYSLVSGTQGDYFFLSRPRRFGKSLLLSTLKEIFLGSKHLFNGLWIAQSDYSWVQFPVIYLDFSTISSRTTSQLESGIIQSLKDTAQMYGKDIGSVTTPEEALKNLVRELSLLGKIVVLIDEYDKPILDHIAEPTLSQAHQEILRSFYAAIKAADAYLRFIFMTGVTKFSKTSVFSGLNNLKDLTLNSEASALLGYTDEEVTQYFDQHINHIVSKQQLTTTQLRENIRLWYNGYQFSREPLKVYNPYSVLLYLSSGELLNYWFETGTPSFLVQLISFRKYPVEAIDQAELSVLDMGSFDIDNIDITLLLLQTGYLTIKSYNEQTRNYQLDYPNEETKISFLYYFVNSLTNAPISLLSNNIFKLTQALRNNNLSLFFSTLEIFFAAIPYNVQLAQEKYYQSIFYVIVSLIGAYVHAEVVTNEGRIDATIETNYHIYIFEFKLNQSAASALQQIEDKRYYQKYLHSNKSIVLVGANFSFDKRNIQEWLVKVLD
ncbi:MAG: ATP-binding protein [Tatlockia sp.]|nr:ATP-binding protein [Tatlockia sp.]